MESDTRSHTHRSRKLCNESCPVKLGNESCHSASFPCVAADSATSARRSESDHIWSSLITGVSCLIVSGKCNLVQVHTGGWPCVLVRVAAPNIVYEGTVTWWWLCEWIKRGFTLDRYTAYYSSSLGNQEPQVFIEHHWPQTVYRSSSAWSQTERCTTKMCQLQLCTGSCISQS